MAGLEQRPGPTSATPATDPPAADDMWGAGWRRPCSWVHEMDAEDFQALADIFTLVCSTGNLLPEKPVLHVLHAVACRLRREGNQEAGLQLFSAMLDVCTSHYGHHHPTWQAAMHGQTSCMIGLGMCQDLEPLLRQHLSICQQLYSDSDWRVTWVKNHLGICLMNLGQYKEAQQWLQQAWRGIRSGQGIELDKHELHFYLGRCQLNMGNAAKAVSLIQGALVGWRRLFRFPGRGGPEDPMGVVAGITDWAIPMMCHLAVAYHHQGKYDMAMGMIEEILDLQWEHDIPDHRLGGWDQRVLELWECCTQVLGPQLPTAAAEQAS